ncbi:hypothetical protein BDY21DRAFT_383581 [Lineolata rhizophorae]|uniref:D-isomer specific 2-hydroxyacid dehydrogenase NAD-binding domain-containing protein n=1 Tax=Lineolata rhizophorae TaxID=578093 RepID=A0A6A6PCW7_9PEZI|nr:hypothetical protein BDY21DRAFT_383581 [Lineolata rhizophorae]
MSSTKPTLLYIGQPITHAHDQWDRFRQSFNIITHDPTAYTDLASIITAFSPSGPYSTIAGIIRPSLSTPPFPKFNAAPPAHAPHHRLGQARLRRRGRGAARRAPHPRRVRESRRADYFAVEAQAVNRSRTPRGDVLGVVGLGAVGAVAARRAAAALGIRVEELGGAVWYASLDEMLGVVDAVVLACPHNEETHHLLNERTFGLMKKGGRVVNVGRGKCLDEAALAEALERGIAGAVGLDVFENEPEVHPKLLGDWRVTLLPHIGGGTVDTNGNFECIAMENIEAYSLGNGKPLTPVNEVKI